MQEPTDAELNIKMRELLASGFVSPAMQIKVPMTLLRQHRDDAVMLLRMAAAANAISSLTLVLSDWYELRKNKTPHSWRDFMQLVALNAALLCEAIRLFRKYGDRPIQLARVAIKVGYYKFDDRRMASALSSGPGSLYDDFLAKWRDKLSFHWDSEPFEKYVDTFHEETSPIWRWPADSLKHPLTCFSPAALTVLVADLSGWPDKTTDASRAMKEVIATQTAMRLLFEAALFGFLIEAGVEPTSFVEGMAEDK